MKKEDSWQVVAIPVRRSQLEGGSQSPRKREKPWKVEAVFGWIDHVPREVEQVDCNDLVLQSSQQGHAQEGRGP